MDLAAQIRVLEAAHGDAAKLALASVDLAYPELPDGERAALTETLHAAAIPHWFDEDILTSLLQIPFEESERRFTRLARLRVVEPFPARGQNAIDVHEANRLALRTRMASDDPARFRLLSRRMADHFAHNPTPKARIEWIYHLVCSDMEKAATELEDLDRLWSGTAHPEDRIALASALAELEQSQLVQGRARVWVLLVNAWTRVGRGETARLGDSALRILELARSSGDPRAEGDAYCLLGDVRSAQGKLAVAEAAFGEYLMISRRLADQEPSNPGWQRELAVALGRVGDVLQVRGNLAGALAAFRESATINLRLTEQYPNYASWQHDLAVARSRLGDVLQAQGNLEEAQTEFEGFLKIRRQLLELDQENADWQRELAVAHARMGNLLLNQNNLAEAQAEFENDLAISRSLAERDPANSGWQRDLAVALSRMGDVLQAQNMLREAHTYFKEYLEISCHLAQQDPGNAGCQRELAVARGRIGDLLEALGLLEDAKAEFKLYSEIIRRLADHESTNIDWQYDLAVSHVKIARLNAREGKREAAIESYGEARRIIRAQMSTVFEIPSWVTLEGTIASELERLQAPEKALGPD